MLKPTIVPSLIAETQEELDERIEKVRKASNLFQLDVMDKKFAPNSSLNFDLKLPNDLKFEAHLMLEEPEKWIKLNGRKVDTILAHIEPLKDPAKTIELIQGLGKKPGLALKASTPVSAVEEFLPLVDEVLVMTVEIGYYGSKFIPEMLEKVRELRRIAPSIDIEVDGGMGLETIKGACEAGANLFISGAYLMKSENPLEAANKLRKILAECNWGI